MHHHFIPTSVSTFSGKVRVMAFVDGGYLESNLKKAWGNDITINYSTFRENLLGYVQKGGSGLSGYLVRIYYYDAIEEGKMTLEQEAKHELVNGTDAFELRLGRLIRDGNGDLKQKGVDALIATDMVEKAHLNHYDVAVLVAGDNDFLDVVKAVKNAGKQVFGFYFDKLTSKELKNSFDMKHAIDDNFATQIRTPQRPHRSVDSPSK